MKNGSNSHFRTKKSFLTRKLLDNFCLKLFDKAEKYCSGWKLEVVKFVLKIIKKCLITVPACRFSFKGRILSQIAKKNQISVLASIDNEDISVDRFLVFIRLWMTRSERNCKHNSVAINFTAKGIFFVVYRGHS